MATTKKSTTATKKSSRKANKSKLAFELLKRYQNRGKYNIVDGSSYMVEQSNADNREEDEVLDPSKRAKLLDLTRNLVRNSSLFNTILGQLTTNVVSTVGGKVVLNISDEALNGALKKSFSKYTRNTDFYTGHSFNRLLKRVLREFVIGGDCVLVFDDGLIEDSGKVLLFEANEIVDVPVSVIEKKYGKGCSISQGKVYSRNGRHIGTVVSKSQKGMVLDKIDPEKCYYLRKDPNETPLEQMWFQFSSNWREGRGVSQAASSISTIHQLEDLVCSELMASRRNSQIFCWLTKKTQESQLPLPSVFGGDDGIDVSELTPEQIEELAKQEADEATQKTISFNKARENSVVYEALPDDYDAKQLDMTHPNTNIQVMVDWLANRCASSMGLSKVFATGNPEDGNWRSNQLFSYPAILELQKELEQVCDWVFYRFANWIGAEIEDADEFMACVSWQWKGLDDLSPVEYQNGIKLALENMTKNYKDILGDDWKEKLEQTAYEHKWMIEHGITPPTEKLLSGGQSESSKQQAINQGSETDRE